MKYGKTGCDLLASHRLVELIPLQGFPLVMTASAQAAELQQGPCGSFQDPGSRIINLFPLQTELYAEVSYILGIPQMYKVLSTY